MSLEALFPNLKHQSFAITSVATAEYNCIAWALNLDDVKWDPSPWYYWPRGIPRNHQVSTIENIFSMYGYEACDSELLEANFDKVAIFGSEGGVYTHVARQLADGRWTSKLGNLEDIAHENCLALAGAEYGKVVRWMRRAVANTEGE